MVPQYIEGCGVEMTRKIKAPGVEQYPLPNLPENQLSQNLLRAMYWKTQHYRTSILTRANAHKKLLG